MSESKELLEATIKGLEEKLNSLNADLRSKERELADINKPEMTSEMFDKLTELVEDAVGNVGLDSDGLEYSMEIDYDNKICLHDVSLNDPSVFSDKIMSEIDSHYKMIDTKE
tara:strand:- start:7 stop:342 length:336 start_codon:yes stop_codon:yes gene_type:complete